MKILFRSAPNCAVSSLGAISLQGVGRARNRAVVEKNDSLPAACDDRYIG
jgi:hypothetical protein